MDTQIISPVEIDSLGQMPDTVKHDLQSAIEILKRHGAKRIILYGSYASGRAKPTSDLDLCEEGVPPSDYFRVWAECLMALDTRLSILDLDTAQGYFRERILREGKVLYGA